MHKCIGHLYNPEFKINLKKKLVLIFLNNKVINASTNLNFVQNVKFRVQFILKKNTHEDIFDIAYFIEFRKTLPLYEFSLKFLIGSTVSYTLN